MIRSAPSRRVIDFILLFSYVEPEEARIAINTIQGHRAARSRKKAVV